MNFSAATLAFGALALFALGYHFYSSYLAHRLFDLNDESKTPAVKKNDGIDFVPTVRPVLFGHHFSSIAGAAPIVGPAVAVIWGWALLQPRDYINGHQLFLGLGALIIGLFISNPKVVAPTFNPDPPGAPFWFPFLFITIACGAVSGFHGLVSSGTTSKQIKRWKDARVIGHDSMVGEGVLALIATLAVATGFSSQASWHSHYGSWQAAKGLAPAIEAFVQGYTQFLAGVGLPPKFASTAIAVLIISFAATSLDTATRIQRYVVAELGESWSIALLKNRYLGGVIAVGTAFLLMMAESGGKGGLLLWPLFGASNQMLAVLTLLVIATFLIRNKKPVKAYVSGRSRELHPQPPSEPYMIVSHHTAPMTFTFPRYLPAVQVSLDSV